MFFFRVYTSVPAADEIPRCYLWLVDPADGLGVSSNPNEAKGFTLDEAEKMVPTLNTGLAVGTTTRFGELFTWERITSEQMAEDIKQYNS